MGIPIEIVDYVEIDKYAVASYNAINGTNFKPQDVKEWDKDVEVDFCLHGSPCFTGDTLVNAERGSIPISEIGIGEKVRCHDGTWQRVNDKYAHEVNETIKVKCSAGEITTTGNHPLYVMRDGKRQWVKAESLKTSDFLCIPINRERTQMKWKGSLLEYNNHHTIANEMPLEDERFWYIIGRFIGDGWVTRRKERNNNISGIKICCGHSELEEITKKVDGLFNYCVVKDRTVYKVQIVSKELGEFCSMFGVGAMNKQIPQKILNLDAKYLKPLLNGLLESDGNVKGAKYKYTSVSKRLAYNIGELVLKVMHIPYHVYCTKRPIQYVIEGRIVNQHDTYDVVWQTEGYNKRINYVDDGYLYARVRKLTKINGNVTVYNLSVENTHTYCVQNIAVHNCQDFSLAGLQKGGDKGSGTRSSLMYETLRIVNKLKPKYVIWENVANLLSEKHFHNFANYLNTMASFGYANAYKLLNAKDYGIPQNRERVFVVSVLGGETVDLLGEELLFDFPKPIPLELRLKDMLESNVDEKYYLSQKGIDYILNDKRIGGAPT